MGTPQSKPRAIQAGMNVGPVNRVEQGMVTQGLITQGYRGTIDAAEGGSVPQVVPVSSDLNTAPNGQPCCIECIPCDLVMKVIIPICLVHNRRAALEVEAGMLAGRTVAALEVDAGLQVGRNVAVGLEQQGVGGLDGFAGEVGSIAECALLDLGQAGGGTNPKRVAADDNAKGPIKKRKTQSGPSAFGHGEMISFAQPGGHTDVGEIRPVVTRKSVRVSKISDKSKGSGGCPKTATGPQ